MIFVFGSNLAGRHGKGAALHAKHYYGAEEGNGHGLQGNSYAIPTKNEKLRTLPLLQIKKYIDVFTMHCIKHKKAEYYLTPIGTGLAGYSQKQIYALFSVHIVNVVLASSWDLQYRKDWHPEDQDVL